MKPASLASLLMRFARPYRRQFVLIAAFAVLATGTDLLSPVIYREAVNDIAGLFVGESGSTGVEALAESNDSSEPAESPVREAHQPGRVASRTASQALTTLLWAAGLLLAINVLSHFCELVADQRAVQLASRIEADVIQKTFAHVLRLPLGFFSRRASGSLAKQIDQSDKVAPIIRAATHDVGPEIIRMVGVLAIMMTQSWRLSVAALITLPPYIWIVLQSSKRLETGLASYYEMWDGVSGRIQDALGAVKTVKLSGAENHESEQLRVASDEAYTTYIERNRLANRYLFWQNSLSYLSQALVLGYGGWLVYGRQLTPGDVVMFVVYLDKLYSPIESLTGLTISLQENVASLKRAMRLLGVADEESTGTAPPPGPGRVEFRDVRFSYVAGSEVLHGVSFALQPGKITALVGPSGAGKTTTTDLLLRLFEPDSGTIVLDGSVLAELDPAAVRREIGVVAADGAIFRSSILENIRYKRPEASAEEVLAVAASAGLSQTLARLPEGLDTLIGEHGIGLSVGERQRLQIARALIARPRVLILDEATANLDYATENAIRKVLFAAGKHPTTLVIAHRYSMVEVADHVIVLEAGRIVDQGSVPELIARGGWFAGFAAGRRATAPFGNDIGANA
jgi:ATP-binding cassette, subfamily B, bacterial